MKNVKIFHRRAPDSKTSLPSYYKWMDSSIIFTPGLDTLSLKKKQPVKSDQFITGDQ